MILSQDVAVDGWALTMLKPKNVGYASTCNSVGQVISLKISSVFKKILCFSTSLLWWSKAIFSHVYCSKKFLRSKLFFMANLFPKFAMSYFHQQTWDKKNIYWHWHWISTQTCGWCLGYILFTTLESAGYITFSQVLLFSFCATQIISPHYIFCCFLSYQNDL